jgi:hypothetical protein
MTIIQKGEPMSDLISRQAAIERIESESRTWGDEYGITDVLCDLDDLPSAEPQKMKGKWIDKSGGIEGAWNYCSVCGEQAIDLYDFCPNCGADMRGEQDG